LTRGQGPIFRTDCRLFTGYRPCIHKRENCLDCPKFEEMGTKILLINLDSMGDVLRTTAILPALKRQYPESHLTWVTLPRAASLLEGNPLVDRVLTLDPSLPIILDVLEFDLALNVDKGLPSGAIMNKTRAPEKLGFSIDGKGSIFPLNPEAEELFRLGLDDRAKFFVNQKTENRLLAEAFCLDYRRDEYLLCFDDDEKSFREESRKRLSLDGDRPVVGFNTGCSNLYPYKKLPLDFLRELAADLKDRRPDWPIILLGGHEDGQRNEKLARELNGKVISTPTDEGLRRGLIYTDLADVVFTGDTLGLHMAIALKKRVVVWFGLTCDQEIELFERGEKILSRVECRPCWQRECLQEVKCFEMVDMKEVLAAIIRQGELALTEKGGLEQPPS
jgi:heptosyltransferase-2